MIEIRPFGPETEADAVHLINAYIAGWPYTRPIDAELLAHWKSLGESYQPGNMLIAYRGGAARCFLHGERENDHHFAHILAVAPGAIEEGAALLKQVEEQARRNGVRRICGPTCRSGRFYGGYILGLEPYHPHWAADVTDAFVQAGYAISQSEALMVADLTDLVAPREMPAGYEIAEGNAEPEFLANVFRFTAVHGGAEVATCGGRLYPRLPARGGGPTGQLGFVGADEQHRGKGLATALVTHSLKRLQEWGAPAALISTGLENTPALRAYERAGFRRRHHLAEWSKALR